MQKRFKKRCGKLFSSPNILHFPSASWQNAWDIVRLSSHVTFLSIVKRSLPFTFITSVWFYSYLGPGSKGDHEEGRARVVIFPAMPLYHTAAEQQ